MNFLLVILSLRCLRGVWGAGSYVDVSGAQGNRMQGRKFEIGTIRGKRGLMG